MANYTLDRGLFNTGNGDDKINKQIKEMKKQNLKYKKELKGVQEFIKSHQEGSK